MAEKIQTAMQRARAVLARRPQVGIGADEPATARWEQGLRVMTRHQSGTQVLTDMVAELGGEGNLATPGWLLRAGLASCLATRIAMEAAAAGIVLTRLEVTATSTSDARGLLGMMDDHGEPVTAAPDQVQLEVSIDASNVPAERLRAMIDTSYRCSPVSSAVERALPVKLLVNIGTS